ELARRMLQRSQRLFEDGRRLTAEFKLSMEIVDAEILLDGRQAIVHYLSWGDCDRRDLLDALSQKHHLLVTLHNLSVPVDEPAEEATTGCGSEGCGRGAGGCGSCTSGGCGTCGSHQKTVPGSSALLEESRVSLL